MLVWCGGDRGRIHLNHYISQNDFLGSSNEDGTPKHTQETNHAEKKTYLL